MKSFSLHRPRQRHECSSDKQSLFMSKEHLFLGLNSLFVYGKRDTFLQQCFSPSLIFSYFVCFITEVWSLDLQSVWFAV